MHAHDRHQLTDFATTDTTFPHTPVCSQALRDLAAADVLAAPAIDASTGDYAGWVSTGGILQQLLRALYPVLLNPELVVGVSG